LDIKPSGSDWFPLGVPREVTLLNCLDRVAHDGLKLKRTFDYAPSREEEEAVELEKCHEVPFRTGAAQVIPSALLQFPNGPGSLSMKFGVNVVVQIEVVDIDRMPEGGPPVDFAALAVLEGDPVVKASVCWRFCTSRGRAGNLYRMDCLICLGRTSTGLHVDPRTNAGWPGRAPGQQFWSGSKPATRLKWPRYGKSLEQSFASFSTADH
jgi:hypothetical protein